MGWLWASNSPDKSSATAQEQSSAVPASPPPSTATAPNEPVDPEIQKFFELFSKDSSKPTDQAPTSEPNASSSTSSDKPATWFSSLRMPAEEPALPPSTLPALSEDLLPSDMSCRQAFDLAWQCNSLGGQWNAVYRYGSMRSCSEQWDDFWFCMRTKSYSPEMRERAIKEHYRKKEHAKYGSGRPSSEDIWEARTTKLEPGTVFVESFDPPKDVDDDEWRRQESERRRKIRDGLGYNKSS